MNELEQIAFRLAEVIREASIAAEEDGMIVKPWREVVEDYDRYCAQKREQVRP